MISPSQTLSCSSRRNTDASYLRVLKQLLEAALFEGIIAFRHDRKAVQFQLAGTTVRARGTVRGFDRVYLEPNTIQAVNGKPVTIEDVVTTLPSTTAKKNQLMNELQHTLLLCRWNEEHLTPPLSRRALSFAELETHLHEGHPYHPCFKARMGFNENDHQRFSPEAGNAFRLHWIAIRREYLDQRIPVSPDAYFWQQELGLNNWSTLQQRLIEAGGDWQNFSLLPVHPWQWCHLNKSHSSAALACAIESGDLLDLNDAGDWYQASQSVRTLLNSSQPLKANIKLPLSMITTSSERTLTPESICAAPNISNWLQQIISSDAYFNKEAPLLLLSEYAGISIRPASSPDHWSNQLQCQLGVIFRTSVQEPLAHSTQLNAVPFTALAAVELDQQLFIQPWLHRYGMITWLKRLLRVLIRPIWHLLAHHGIALETHAQNLILLHHNGWPQTIIARDFHESLEYVPYFLRNPEWTPDFNKIHPAYEEAPMDKFYWMQRVSSLRELIMDTLFVFNLSELAGLLERQLKFPETQFWKLVTQELQQYSQTKVTHPLRLQAIGIDHPRITTESLLRKKIHESNTNEFSHPINNALY